MKFVFAALALHLLQFGPARAAETVGNDAPELRATERRRLCPSDTRSAPAKDVAFEASTQAFPNPDKGFYRAVGDLANLEIPKLRTSFNEGTRLVFAEINLAAFRSKPISRAHLKRLEEGFERIRRAGLKVIVRFRYDQAVEGNYQVHDPKLSTVLGHIEQSKALLEKNKDVIFLQQAGFIGAWGEWHSSELTKNRRAYTTVAKAIIDASPAERTVAFRYPPHLMQIFTNSRGEIAAPGNKRVTFHNDCIISSSTDVGTYDEDPNIRRRQRGAMARLVREAGGYGGEVCEAEDADENRKSCAEIRREGKTFGLTYLNREYDARFFEKMAAQGCRSEVRRKMGYNFVLNEARITKTVSRGCGASIALTLSNEGWSRPLNSRKVKVTLTNRETGEKIERVFGKIDLRRIGPNQTLSMRGDMLIPENIDRGRYAVSVSLIDPLLPNDPRYNIRPANSNRRGQVWSEASGSFSLGTDIEID